MQISTILDDLKSYYTTLSIIEDVFEKKANHRPLMQAYFAIQDMIWKNKGMKAILDSQALVLFEKAIKK